MNVMYRRSGGLQHKYSPPEGGCAVVYTVGISDMKVSDNESDILVTHSLGSCIGLSLYDPEIRVGGLVHCMMPVSKLDPVKAAANPLMFTDTGVTALLKAVFDRGANRKRLIVTVAGAASLLDDKGFFKIGEKNHTILRKILWKNDILISEEDVGGNIVRTMYLYMNTGKTVIKRNILNMNAIQNEPGQQRARSREEK